MTATPSAGGLRILQIGNFSAPHSTECHLRRALVNNGHQVDPVQENEAPWADLAARAADHSFVLWTHTRDYAPPATYEAQRRFLADCPVPTVGAHLDLWHGLAGAHLVDEEPYFHVDLLATADGGHDEEWEKAGVNHRWMPPGVSAAECEPGTFREELASPVVFVGSWQSGYHRESRHRAELVAQLKRRRQKDVRFWPKLGEHAIRGEALRDLYASTTVAVGDSCLVGTGLKKYWSDRVPESVGRGACFLHPVVDGLFEHYEDGTHLYTWEPGDWRSMHRLIDMLTADPELARKVGEQGRAHVLATATYERRMSELVDLMQAEGLL